MENSSLISIILPVYNGEAYLGEAIKSILNQTYTNFELIIINDASTDRSLEIAEKYSSVDERIKIYSNEKNLLLPDSLNIGHKHSNGQYITWTSDDNLLKPDFLKSLFNCLLSTKSDVVYSDYDIIYENGDLKRVHRTGELPSLIFENIIGASFLYKRKVFKEVNGYDPSLFLVEDYFFFFKASLKFKFHHTSKNLYQYRIHEKSLTREININKHFSKRYRIALQKMYSLMGDTLNWYPETSEFLLKLNLEKSINLKNYLAIRNILENDIIKYDMAMLRNGNLNEQSNVLRTKVRQRWQGNKNQQTLKNLLLILKNDIGLLLVPGFNHNSNISLIFSCFINKKNLNF